MCNDQQEMSLDELLGVIATLFLPPPDMDYLALWNDPDNWETISGDHLAFVGPDREWPKTCAVFRAFGGWNYLLYECNHIPKDTFGIGGFDTIDQAKAAALEHALDIIGIPMEARKR